MKCRIFQVGLVVAIMGSTTIMAQADEATTYVDVPAQPLASALRQLADQMGLQLAVETTLTSGKTSQAVKGEMSTSTALETLLNDSGLHVEFLDNRVVAVSSNDAPDMQSGQQSGRSQAVSSQQAVATKGGGTLEEIVVTAEFRRGNVQETPLAITAISAEAMRERGDVTVPDLANGAPNVTFNSGTGIYAGAQFFIRGVGQTDPHPALEPGVGIYIDDVYYGAVFGGDMNLLDLERVELLRGPQGTLAGANSIGGAVKLFTAKPTGSGGYVEAGYGSNETMTLRGAFDTTLIEDRLFMRVSGGLQRDDGYVDRVDFACANPAQAGTLPLQSVDSTACEVGQAGGKDSSVLRGALRWIASDRLEINVSAEDAQVDSQPAAEALIAINPANPLATYNAQQQATWGVQFDERFIIPEGRYVTYADYTDRDGRDVAFSPNGHNKSRGYVGTIDYALTDQISLKSITGYRKVSGYAPGDFDASPLSISTAGRVLKYSQLTEELRLSGNSFGGFLDWTVGGFYYDADAFLGGLVDIQGVAVPFGGLVTYYADDSDSEKQALFSTVTLHPTDDLSITAGYRYSHSEKNFNAHHTDPQNGFVVAVLGAGMLGKSPPVRSYRSDYRLAIQYEWTPELMTYAQVATGYKDGGVNPFAVAPREDVPFDQETMKSYEIGLKSELFDRHMRLNLAGFISKYDDLQLRGQIPAPSDPSVQVSVITNAGKVTMKGLEAEIELRPTSELLISASGSYIDFSYDELGAAGTIANGPCLDCTNIYTPEYKASLMAQYEVDLGNFGSLTPRLSADYQDSVFTDLANAPALEIPSRWIANARLTWRDPASVWEASLSVKNLFDEYYYTHITQQYYSLGVATGNIGRPREVMLSVRRDF